MTGTACRPKVIAASTSSAASARSGPVRRGMSRRRSGCAAPTREPRATRSVPSGRRDRRGAPCRDQVEVGPGVGQRAFFHLGRAALGAAPSWLRVGVCSRGGASVANRPTPAPPRRIRRAVALSSGRLRERLARDGRRLSVQLPGPLRPGRGAVPRRQYQPHSCRRVARGALVGAADPLPAPGRASAHWARGPGRGCR